MRTNSMSIASIRALRLLMPISAVSSSIAQTVAIMTNHWLYTEELTPNEKYEKFKMPSEMEFFRKWTTSGLWTVCNNDPPNTEMRCWHIDYFNGEEYIPEQNDSTMAIPYAIKQASIFIFLSFAFLCLGQAIYFSSKCCTHRSIYTLISGITLILAGLDILAGIVVYISTFKGEVSNKLRPMSEFQEPLFRYRYGFSFLMLVASLILCEISGTLSIFLYVSQKQFQIMIEAEREEVLKKNILALFGAEIKNDNEERLVLSDGPVLRIIGDESDNDNHVPEDAPISSIDHNFLSPEFGAESLAFYYCGRHGSRGRRNSRSNESFLGSSRDSSESRKNSFISIQDEPSIHNNNPTNTHRANGESSSSLNKNTNYGNERTLYELHVPSLLHRLDGERQNDQKFRSPHELAEANSSRAMRNWELPLTNNQSQMQMKPVKQTTRITLV